MANPAQPMSQKTGDAKIVRSGHTQSTKHGADPNATAVQRPTPTDSSR